MGNTILTPDIITRTALEVLENNLVLARTVNRQYDSSFGQDGAKIGSQMRVRKPPRYTVSNGAALQVQDAVEQSVTLAVTNQAQIGLQFTSAELTMGIDDFREQIIEPAVSQMASSIDANLATVFAQIGNSVGTPGTTPADDFVLLQARQKLSEMAAPPGSRYAAINPAANASLVHGLKGLFNPPDIITRQFKTGIMAEGILGYDEINETQSIPMFATGTRTNGTVSVTSVQGDATLVLTGLGANATLAAGEVFTVAGTNAVNPQTRVSTGSLYQFVVMAAVTASAGGVATVTVQAPIFAGTSQQLAIVDVLPVATSVVTFMGAASGNYPQNLVYHKDAVTLATADLVLPKGVDMAARAQHNGISMRLLRDYSIQDDRMYARLDVLYGFVALRPELAVRMWG